MAKPDWGRKRTCQSCGALFYDMKKDPAACPKCGTEDTLQPLLKPRRAAPAAPKPAPAKEKETADETDGVEIDDVEIEDDDEEDDLIVDASDLGDEDDDVSEVKEHIEPSDDKE